MIDPLKEVIESYGDEEGNKGKKNVYTKNKYMGIMFCYHRNIAENIM